MLIAFFKSHEDKECDCEIVKFVDRIWVEKKGDLKCIRTLMIHVKNGSTIPLKYIRILTPFREIPELSDMTETCLDQNFLFNGFSTGGYKIRSSNPEQHYGIISYDYFQNVKVYTDSEVKSYQSPTKNYKTIAIDFPKHPIVPGEFRLLRFSFSITSILDALFPRVYSFMLDYFNNKSPYIEDCRLLNIQELEVPVNKLFNKEKKQGGFDIFVYLPPNLSCTNFNATTQLTSKHLPDGKESKTSTQKFIWRARNIFPDDMVTHLKIGITPLSINGLLNDPFEMEEIRGAISTLKDDTATLKSESKKALKIGIIALIFSIISLMIVFYDSIKNLILSIFGIKA